MNLIGVRYIGKKDQCEDSVCNTKAVWLPGQVLNFSESLAAQLLVHTDSFEQVDAEPGAQVFLEPGKLLTREPPLFVNLSQMDAQGVVQFVRFNFQRELDAARPIEDLRRDALTLMINRNLDEIADSKGEQAEGRVPVPYLATAEEYEGMSVGALKLVVVAVGDEQPQQPATGQQGDDKPIELQTLLAGMTKAELIEFATAEGVAVDAKAKVDDLRTAIYDALSTRAGNHG